MQNASYNGSSATVSSIPEFHGTLERYLSLGTSTYGVYWKLEENGNVSIYYTDTRYFTYNAPQTSRTFSTTIGDSGSGSSSTTSSSVSSTSSMGLTMSQSTSGAMTTDPFADAVTSINSMLTKGYGTLSSNRSTNTIVVHDVPPVLDQVQGFVDEQNEKINAQVFLHIKIYSVKATKSDNYGLNWSALYSYLAKTASVNITSNYSGFTNSSPSTMQFNVLGSSSSPFAGSTMIAQALSQQGDVSVVTSLDQPAFVNRPTPVQSGQSIIYGCGTSTTAVTNTGVVNAVQQCSFDVGIKMTIIPTIIGHDKISIEAPVDLTTLLGWDTVGTGSAALQVPEIDSRKISPSALLRSGETVVISGLEETSDTVDKQGIGSANFWGAGGGRNASTEKDFLVIVITATVMNT